MLLYMAKISKFSKKFNRNKRNGGRKTCKERKKIKPTFGENRDSENRSYRTAVIKKRDNRNLKRDDRILDDIINRITSKPRQHTAPFDPFDSFDSFGPFEQLGWML